MGGRASASRSTDVGSPPLVLRSRVRDIVGALVSSRHRKLPLDRSGAVSLSPPGWRPRADGRGRDHDVSCGRATGPGSSRETLYDGWIVIAVLIPAALFFISTAILAVSDNAAIEWRDIGRSTEFPELSRPVYWLADVVCYGFGEEVGWRGFALPRLQFKRSALGASMMPAFGWAGWHLPIFFFSPGLSSLGVAGIAGWFMSLAIGSILLTWLFNSSRGSIGAVALFDGALDIFISSPVALALPNTMGALLTIGTLLSLPALARRERRHPR